MSGVAGFLVCLGLGWETARAQDGVPGVAWQAETPDPETLQSHRIDLAPFAGQGIPGRIQYELDFATLETPATGFLFDSLTLSLSRADGSDAVLLVTGDVFGLTIAPLFPGGLLAGGGISVTEAPVRMGAMDGASVQFAYTVEVFLPPALVDAPLRTQFDFFNNGDLVASRGQVRVVPEPGWVALLVVGIGFLLAGPRPGGVR